MNGRALRRLREERENAKKDEINAKEEEEEEEEDAMEATPKTGGAFLSMLYDDDSQDESDADEQDVAVGNVEENSDGAAAVLERSLPKIPPAAQPSLAAEPDENATEDLDAILAEFKVDQDEVQQNESSRNFSWFADIVDGLDVRDLDVESVMRYNLMGGEEQPSSQPRRGRQPFLFGPPKDSWVRPPHYVGGGIGMSCYDQESKEIPWPYTMQQEWSDPKSWFTFKRADTYAKSLDFYHEIQQSGDVNALALFVADNPFVPEALLQLAKVAYETNQSQEGLALLRRSLWTQECSSIKSFSPQNSSYSCFIDSSLPANEAFFEALFRLMQASSISGCMRTALAVSRYLLALDPLRDPKGSLLAMDFFALSTMDIEHDLFVVRLVEGDKIMLHYKDEDQNNFVCGLREMPNWAYSYALALYRVECSLKSEYKAKGSVSSSDALESAITRFPNVVEKILVQSEVDILGRTTRMDWPLVLKLIQQSTLPPSQSPEYDPVLYHASRSVCDMISRIYVKRACELWKGDNTLLWLYRVAEKVVTQSQTLLCYPSPALQIYNKTDPVDFDDRFRLLPPEANPLDPGMLALSLVIDPRRRRLFRRAGGREADRRLDPLQALGPRNAEHGLVIGGPPTQTIDPDSPMLEVFLQSMLPWNHVEGIPAPRR